MALLPVPGSRLKLTVAAAAVTVLVVLGWRLLPRETLIGQARGYTSVALSAPLDGPGGEARNCPNWRIHLAFDRDLAPPGPEWVLHEGRRPGEGYELHWSPQQQCLRLQRVGEATVQLGAASLGRMPSALTIRRSGARIGIDADGRRIIEVLDPMAPEAPSAWGFQTSGARDEATITLHDDGARAFHDLSDLVSADAEALRAAINDPRRRDAALIGLRLALGGDPQRGDRERQAALGLVQSLLDRRGNPTDDGGPRLADHDRLRAWLAYGWLESQLARKDDDAGELASRSLEVLSSLASRRIVQEAPGLLLSVLPRLVERAIARPGRPDGLAATLDRRQAWLAVLDDAVAAALATAGPDLDERQLQQLQLIGHAARCLAGRPPLPTPASAADWLTTRWRTFAGNDPRQSALPAIPVGGFERNPVLPALERLVAGAGFEPLAAVRMRAQIDELLVSAPLDRAALLARLAGAPTREAVLTRALLALDAQRRSVDRQLSKRLNEALAAREIDDALSALAMPADGSPGGASWSERDPLAFALERLLVLRSQAVAGGNDLESSAPAPDLAPFRFILRAVRSGADREHVERALRALAPFERFLRGNPAAADEIWVSVLAPEQTLACVLVIQELRALAESGTPRPDWALLERLPSFTLPLHLLAPGGAPSGTADPQPGIP